MKVVIIGGSAQSTPALFEYLAEAQTGALQVTLMGRDEHRLAAVARASRLLSTSAPIALDYVATHGPEFMRALEGADVVILQARVGGYRGRAYDETFPLRYGVCGDEGLGPGGLAAAWRAWPEIAPLIAQVQIAAPAALLVIMSAPLGILVKAARHACPRLRVVGICELPWTTLQEICSTLNENPEAARFEYCGVNHLGWFHHVCAGGRDLVSEYAAARPAADQFPAGEIIAKYQGVPTKYLKLHYQSRQVIDRQRRAGKSRGQILDDLSRAAFPVFRAGTREAISAALHRRAAPWYRHAVGPFLLALMGQMTRVPFFLSTANHDFCSSFAPDDVLEIPHQVENRRLQRLNRSRPIPAHIVQTTRNFVEFERAAADALIAKDVTGIERALRLHPWTRQVKALREMAREITQPFQSPEGETTLYE
jgi:6-phospho-beta-glucosidase